MKKKIPKHSGNYQMISKKNKPKQLSWMDGQNTSYTAQTFADNIDEHFQKTIIDKLCHQKNSSKQIIIFNKISPRQSSQTNP